MEAMVPESALAYVEINDLPALLNQFTSTTAWQQLAPAYGIPARISYLGTAGRLARWTGIGPAESVVLARAQLAVVVTGIEVRSEEVRPRLAVVAETHVSENRLRTVIENRLPQLATRAYQQPEREATEYLGVPITVYRAPQSERRILSAQLGSQWIVANHPDSMRACIETRLGRSPSMANSNFYLKTARPLVAGKGDSELFAFVSGTGMVRLLQFATSLIAGRITSATPFAGALESLLADVSSRTVDGAAYSTGFAQGNVVSRSVLLFKPAIVDRLKTSIRTGNAEGSELQALKITPATVRDVTVVNVENPLGALDNLELALSSQLGTGQSFVLHRIFLGAREALLGLKPNENPAPAFGNEIASLSFSQELSDRVLLIAARDRSLLQGLAEKFLTSGGAGLSRQQYHDTELLISSNRRRGACAFVGNFLALGGLEQLLRLIDVHRVGSSITSAPQFTSARPGAKPAPIISYTSVREETGELMTALSRRVSGMPVINLKQSAEALEKLPLAVSTTALTDYGLYTESHAPLGSFPLFVSLVEGSAGN